MYTSILHSLTTLTRASLAVAIASASLAAFAGPDTLPVQANAMAVEARQQATDMTESLLALNARWQRSAASQQSDALARLVETARQRRQLLLEMMPSNPAEVRRVLIPESRQLGMPAEVLELLESRIELEGEIERFYEDYEDGSHQLKTFLVSDFGERFELHLDTTNARITHGSRVRANGWTLGAENGLDKQGDMVLSEDLQPLELANDGTAAAAGDITPKLTNTLGEQRTLMMLLNFSDDRSQPWSVAQAQSMLFGTVDNFIRENSAGRTWLSGDVVGWNTLSLSSTVCDSLGMRSEAYSIAQNRGIDIAGYDRIIFAFPKNACGYSGSGTIGGAPSYSFINGSMILRTVAHELGHNLGLFHAHSLECGAATEGSSCTSYAYGDTLDIMGYYNRVGHYNGFAKELLGWLSQKELVTATASGQYQLAPFVSGSDQPKVLKVLKESDASLGNSYYYVEMRQPEGEDAQLFDGTKVVADNVSNGVIIHHAHEGNADTSHLLDMTPGSASFGYDDWEDPALTTGATFASENGSVSIAADWVDASRATVNVTLDGSSAPVDTCTLVAPAVSVSGDSSLWGTAGSTQSYSLQVSNPNDASCGTLTFSLQAQVPTGWGASFSNSSLSLAAGASSSVTLAVTSAASAAAGFYDLDAIVSDSGNQISASTTLTYVVEAPVVTEPTPPADSNTAPVAQDDTVSLSSKSSVTVAVLGNDYDADNDTLTIAAVGSPAKGTVRVNGDGTITYTPHKSFKDSDSFSYTITDGKASATATVSLSLSGSTSDSSPTTGNKGNGKGANK